MLKEVTILDAATKEDLSGSFTIDHTNKEVTGSVAFEVEKIEVSAKTTTTAAVTVASPISLNEGENGAVVLRFTYKDSSGTDQAIIYNLIVTREEEVITSSEVPSIAPESEDSGDVVDMAGNSTGVLVIGVILLLLGIVFLGYGVFDCVLAIKAKKSKNEKYSPRFAADKAKNADAEEEEDLTDLFAEGTLQEKLSEEDFVDLSSLKKDQKKK